jgi:ubiquinone biosynthesis protein COQ9
LGLFGLVFRVSRFHILAMSETNPYLDIETQVLASALPNVAFDGWSEKLLQQAIASSGVDENMAVLAFPKGVGGLIRRFSADGDARMLAALPDGESLKIRERITEAVWTRLRVDGEHKEAARRAAGWLALPTRQKLGAKLLFESANQIWRWAGDSATDYNYYSKRVILSGVIVSTRLTWFDDDSEDEAKTRAFLERRIENVMQFEKLKAKATAWSGKLHGDKAPFEGVWSSLAKMRYRK